MQRIANCPEIAFVHDNNVKSKINVFNEQEYLVARSLQRKSCKVVLEDVCSSHTLKSSDTNESIEDSVLAVLSECLRCVEELNDGEIVEKQVSNVLNKCLDDVLGDIDEHETSDGLVNEIAKEFELFKREIKFKDTVDAGIV